MSDQIETPDFANMDIGKLRQYASHLRVPLAKTATKAEIVEAISKKLGSRTTPEIASEETTLKPGYSRIRILADPMPGAANLPVFINANGYICTIPRDVEVVVPERVVRVLRDAKVNRRKQAATTDNHGREVFKETTVVVPSYPFEVIEKNPGPEVYTNLELSKQKTMGPKRRYREMFGHWPRPRELTRAIEQKLITLEDDESLSRSEEKLIGTEPTV